jgi:hypothetical protein
MPLRALVSHHLDLYRYWLAKRGRGAMPARSDINPADIPALLPHLGLIEKVDGRFRYRLVGTAIAEQFGRDQTGSLVGTDNRPESLAAKQAIYERFFASARPVFTSGQYETKLGATHNVSLLILPLSEDCANVNMAVFTRITRFSFEAAASKDWLKGAPLKMGDVVNIDSTADIEKLCLEWERSCGDQSQRA